MNKIAVNPTQFITCRLCLEELGSYQIVPSVKEQIAYCFDIKVEPFDGLPQLICQKCEEILSAYSKIKKKFCEKQNELMGKIHITKGSHGHLPALQPKESPSPSKRKLSSSSSDQEYNIGFKNKRLDRSSYKSEERDVAWQANYTKQFVCKICSSHWSNSLSLKNHINKKHNALFRKYGSILKRHCQVHLYKSDEKPNLTGSNNNVVLYREKIVKNLNANYHVIYTIKDYNPDRNYNSSHINMRKKKNENSVKNKSYTSSDSSDEDIVMKRKRIRRISSRSSSDTFILDIKSNNSDDDESRKSETVEPPSSCIDLDDSSEAETEKRNPAKTKKRLPNKNDSKAIYSTIDEIVTSCRNKYIKKHYHDNNSPKNSSDIANKLQHKIFSIGRKIINKRIGVNCTPLLRFLEHKNLDITWLPRDILSVCQDSNHIRIIPRRKNTEEKVEENETGWTDSTYKSSLVAINFSDNTEEANIETNVQNGIDILESPIVAADIIITPDPNLGCTEIKKLLNANPVANPKQLPKKFAFNDVNMPKAAKPAEFTQEEDSPGSCMPIITSTTSLAVTLSVPDNNDPKRPEIDSTQPEAPRIKVKPVSELMSAETLNRMNNPMQQGPMPLDLTPMHIPVNIIGKGLPLSVQNVSVPTSPLPIVVTSQSLLQSNNDITKLNAIRAEPPWQSDYLVLDTVDMPNMKTNSPYLYVKKLLQMHNITLMETNAENPKDFHCLIKFKVLYKQDAQHQPVTLCLSLFCSKNIFCFKVKNRNNENIDIMKLACNWQWEVLKIYKGEVVNKLLLNAQKIGKDVYESTNSFLCLLKSVNNKTKS